MKKICNLILSLLIVTILLPHYVNAGVVKEMVEVDETQRLLDEQERIRLQEEYKKEAIEQVKAPEVQPPEVQPQEDLEEVARRLRESEINQRAETVETAAKTTSSSTCSSCTACDKVHKLVGAIVGVPVGAVVGLLRGSAAKGADMAESYPDDLGGGLVGNAIGVPGGVVVGGISGGVTGLVDGIITGAVEGWRNPFTRESFLLDGPFLDYNPYELGAE